MTFRDSLQHHGVKGMKWGVRRDAKQLARANKEPSKLSKQLDSMKREREWRKVVQNVDKLTTKEIRKVDSRIKLENDLKTLSKSKVGNSKDKQDYLRRGKMSDQELSRKVTRLRAKENLSKSVRSASKEQREFGSKVVDIGGALGVKYALNKSITPKDVFDAYNKPKESRSNAQKDLLNAVYKPKNQMQRDLLNDMLNKVVKEEKK